MENRTLPDAALVSAALRHLRDSEHLSDADNPSASMDQAYHLAGFAPECIRKAILASSWVFKPLGHAVGAEADLILDVFLSLEPGLARYDLSGWAGQHPRLSSWKPDVRYERTGTRSGSETLSLVSEVREVTTHLLASLWADGALDQEALEW